MVSARIDEVEAALILALRQWLADYQAPTKIPAASAEEERTLETALQKLNAEIAAIEDQRTRAFDLVETGIYTPELFKERQAILASRRDALISSASETRQMLDRLIQNNKMRRDLIPRVQTVLETYNETSSAQEKNDMLRSIVSKIVYSKTHTAFSEQGSDLTLTIYPVIPDNLH